jgi:hypothetical protein
MVTAGSRGSRNPQCIACEGRSRRYLAMGLIVRLQSDRVGGGERLTCLFMRWPRFTYAYKVSHGERISKKNNSTRTLAFHRTITSDLTL